MIFNSYANIYQRVFPIVFPYYIFMVDFPMVFPWVFPGFSHETNGGHVPLPEHLAKGLRGCHDIPTAARRWRRNVLDVFGVNIGW